MTSINGIRYLPIAAENILNRIGKAIFYHELESIAIWHQLKNVRFVPLLFLIISLKIEIYFAVIKLLQNKFDKNLIIPYYLQ